jgi:eukaryotic-like serine/threonine-protein kinase
VRINSKGGYCNVSVNGAAAGATPTEAVVPAGNVRISCKPPSGPTQTQVVRVGAGETARVSFKLD